MDHIELVDPSGDMAQVWELAEALGTWQLDQHGFILTCQWEDPGESRDGWVGKYPRGVPNSSDFFGNFPFFLGGDP